MDGDDHRPAPHHVTAARTGDRFKCPRCEKLTMKVVTSSTRSAHDLPTREDGRRTATFASMAAAMARCGGTAAYAVRPMH